MTQPTGSVRRLGQRLSNSANTESDTPSDSILITTLTDWSEPDPNVKIPIVLDLSLNEYVALANSIDVGRDIAYGDNSILIWFIWVRALQSMAICDAIIACIEDEQSGVAQAIVNVVNNSSSTELIDSAQGQNDLILGDGNNPTCDFDILWGGVNNLVDQLDVNNLDALEILEVATNSAEWVSEVLANVLGVKPPIIGAALEWGTFIQDSILENYEAQITVAYMDTLKCDLFCLAKFNDCELTAEMLVDYFFGRLASVLTFQSLLNESLEFIFLGVWTGTEIADAMMLSQLVFRAQFGSWFKSINFRKIDLDIRLGYDDPSDDWELLCDCSDPACLNYLNSEVNDTVLATSLNTFQTGGVRMLKGSGGAWRLRMQANSPPVQIFDQITIEWDASNGVIGSAETLNFVHYSYDSGSPDDHPVSFTPPFGDPSGTRVSYAVPLPDPLRLLVQVYIQWETVAGGGTSGSCFVREVCYETA